MPHEVRTAAATVEEGEVDPWEQRINSTGCAPQHYALQDCYSETGDWRKCQEHMAAFRLCMSTSTKSKESTKATVTAADTPTTAKTPP
eukprot:m.212133 g.212133  ORF g.212133 m.212133 type:complete len:88 (-) comp25518_c0_seq1:46-309(-)